jgi:spore coat polysaccharide biosynthesis protein SpsF
MTVGAFVQARMGSQRLPGKSLMSIWHEMPLLELVLRRVAAAKRVDQVVLVTSQAPADAGLVEVADRLGIESFAGPEDDVLRRFVEALEVHPADAVVRVCADNPFIDPAAIDDLVEVFAGSQPCDYASNHTEESGLPDGIGAEIVAADALVQADERAPSAYEREHVTLHLLKHPEEFRIVRADPPEPPYPFLKLDVDTAEDLERMREVARRLDPGDGPAWGVDAIVAAAA